MRSVKLPRRRFSRSSMKPERSSSRRWWLRRCRGMPRRRARPLAESGSRRAASRAGRGGFRRVAAASGSRMSSRAGRSGDSGSVFTAIAPRDRILCPDSERCQGMSVSPRVPSVVWAPWRIGVKRRVITELRLGRPALRALGTCPPRIHERDTVVRQGSKHTSHLLLGHSTILRGIRSPVSLWYFAISQRLAKRADDLLDLRSPDDGREGDEDVGEVTRQLETV